VVNISKPLSKQGLSYSFDIGIPNGGDAVMLTHIRHTNGGSFTTRYYFDTLEQSGSKNSAQARKSSITYARRASLELALGIATIGADDDAKRSDETISTEEQLDKIKSLIEVTNTTEDKFFKYMKIESLDDLSGKDAKTAISVLQQKKKIMVLNQGEI
jgi:YD repeat-containing protein